MANEPRRQTVLLTQVLRHLDSVLDTPERRHMYPCSDSQHANFTPALELQASDNLRVSVGLARLYAAQHLSDGSQGLESLRSHFEGSDFTIREEDEQIAIVGQYFVLDQIKPRMQTHEVSR